MRDPKLGAGHWRHGVPIRDRGPGRSYRPDQAAPSVFAPHQPGIATPQLEHLVFAAFDLPADGGLRDLLVEWSALAERLMHEAWEIDGSNSALTLTLGLGAGAFARAPVGLRPLPAFRGDALEAALCGGDLCVQACAHDHAVALHAVAALRGAAGDRVAERWRQSGFLTRAPGDRRDGTPRDLLGFKHGTGNPRRALEFDRHVWIARGDRRWMIGGTYLVTRRIRVRFARWDALRAEQHEQVIGRRRRDGAPLGGAHEFEALPLDDRSRLPLDAHVRLASARANAGRTILRRGYSYDNGITAGGTHDAGLLLLAFQRDPQRQFVRLQRRLAEEDRLSEFIEHVGSAVFAIPPGAKPGGFIADGLAAA